MCVIQDPCSKDSGGGSVLQGTKGGDVTPDMVTGVELPRGQVAT